MKFLIDQDVYAVTVRFLSGLGHDAVPVAQLGLASAEDEHLLEVAQNQSRILVTRDRDYGNLVFVEGKGGGVLYLRMLPSSVAAVHDELARVLTMYSEEDLRATFVVIEPGRHRVRKPPQNASEPPAQS